MEFGLSLNVLCDASNLRTSSTRNGSGVTVERQISGSATRSFLLLLLVLDTFLTPVRRLTTIQRCVCT
jgi:hypothetical protein